MISGVDGRAQRYLVFISHRWPARVRRRVTEQARAKFGSLNRGCIVTRLAEQGRLKLPTPTTLITHREFAVPTPAADFAGVPPWKRVLDICCVLAGAILLPMLLLIAIAIKLGSKGPVLFKQERVGLFGKRFIIFKFRTMIPGADTAVHEAHAATLIESNTPMTKLDAHGDPRVTPFGRLLRVAGLDELPQLINVLRGEMSFVGPRPCLPSEYNRYLPWQTERFFTQPGLTGLWQVSGKNRTTFNEMVDLDIQYVRERSLWLDLKIILKTIPAVMVQVRDMQSPRRPTTPSHSTVDIQTRELIGDCPDSFLSVK
jgi:lipopolysaccharide/colanic/teichoic acid biosynthesis glycosyltransferase